MDQDLAAFLNSKKQLSTQLSSINSNAEVGDNITALEDMLLLVGRARTLAHQDVAQAFSYKLQAAGGAERTKRKLKLC